MSRPLSKARSAGVARVVAGPLIDRVGETLAVLVLIVSKIRIEPAPVLATNSRSAAWSRNRYCGPASVVLEPVMVAAGATLPLAVRALSKRRIEFVPWLEI